MSRLKTSGGGPGLVTARVGRRVRVVGGGWIFGVKNVLGEHSYVEFT